MSFAPLMTASCWPKSSFEAFIRIGSLPRRVGRLADSHGPGCTSRGVCLRGVLSYRAECALDLFVARCRLFATAGQRLRHCPDVLGRGAAAPSDDSRAGVAG